MRDDRTVFDTRPGIRVGPGTRLSDLYEIDAPIAAGGMGEVFLGHAIETGDVVAIKVMRTEFAENAKAIALFRKEASALHNVHHEAVVRHYVFAVDRALGLPFLAMEHVPGESLADRLKRGRLDHDAVDILRRRLAGGLGAAHAAGIIHRDVTPDNIILPTGDPARAKIIDFGIARLAETQTVIGDGFAGKYAYVSPEQLGLQGGEITARSDIYSLGLVLAQASRGRALDMVGDGPADAIARRSSVPDLADIDRRLAPLLESMLRPDPQARPRSMAEVEAWRAPTIEGVPRPKAPAGPRRGRTGLAIGGAAIALAGGLAAVALLWPAGTPPVQETAPLLAERPQPAPPPSPAAPPLAEAVPDRPPDPGPALPAKAPPVTRVLPPPRPAAAPGEAAPDRPPDPGPTPSARMATAEIPPVKRVLPSPARPDTVLDPGPAPGAAAEPPPPTDPTMEKVAAFIRGYRGGACFFLNPTTVSAREAMVEAYGTASRPVLDFDAAFRKAFGFEAQIQLRQVEPGQCPVVDLLARQAQAKQTSVPKLRLDSDRLRSGEELRGSVDLGDAPNLTLLLVTGDGSVHDLARHLKWSGRQADFAVRLEVPPAGRGRSQLVVAVGSREPVAAPAGRLEPGGDGTFAGLARAAGRPGSGLGLAAHQIKVGN